MPIDFLTLLKNFSALITFMIGIFKIAYFGLQFIEIFLRRVFAPAPLAVIVAIQCKVVVLKSLVILTSLGNWMKNQEVWLVTLN